MEKRIGGEIEIHQDFGGLWGFGWGFLDFSGFSGSGVGLRSLGLCVEGSGLGLWGPRPSGVELPEKSSGLSP